MPVDISKYIHDIEGKVRQILVIAPKHWKGNYPPETHHFDEGSIVFSADVDAASQKAFIAFSYADSGTQHVVQANLNVGGDLQPHWTVTLDGTALPGEAHVVFTHRNGLEGFNLYERAVVIIGHPSIPGGEHTIRFDGDLV